MVIIDGITCVILSKISDYFCITCKPSCFATCNLVSYPQLSFSSKKKHSAPNWCARKGIDEEPSSLQRKGLTHPVVARNRTTDQYSSIFCVGC